MDRLANIFLLVILILLVAGCDTLNVGVGGFGPGHVTRINSASITEYGTGSQQIRAGETALFELSIGDTGTKDTISVTWAVDGLELDFSYLDGPEVLRSSQSSLPEHHDRQLALIPQGTAAGEYQASYSVSGFRRETLTGVLGFTVVSMDNQPPVFESVSWDGKLLHVRASDPDGDRLHFNAEVISGSVKIGDGLNRTDNSIDYPIVANNLLAGTDFAVRITVEDLINEPVQTFYESSFDGLYLENDTLYAVASRGIVEAGGSVRVVVATGITNNPFQYLNGCGVVCENGASYLPGSFDVGDLDDTPDVGSANPIDGVWADMGATSFLLAPDNFITGTDLGDGTSRTDFNVTPLGGNDIHATGILFSFEYSFASAGTHTLGFEAVNVVSRTYYQDSSASTDYFWSDISNLHPYNTIVVVE